MIRRLFIDGLGKRTENVQQQLSSIIVAVLDIVRPTELLPCSKTRRSSRWREREKGQGEKWEKGGGGGDERREGLGLQAEEEEEEEQEEQASRREHRACVPS